MPSELALDFPQKALWMQSLLLVCLSLLVLDPCLLIGRFCVFGFLWNEAAAWNKKNKSKDQGADNVVLDRTSSERPNKNTSGYLPDS
jgi:hypothetical protein